MKTGEIRQLTRLALMFALAIVLMVLEHAIPPIPSLPPGVKLGLSNIVVMYCVFFLGKKQAITLILLKSIFVLSTRGATAFLLSLCGGIFSAALIIILSLIKKPRVSYIIMSISAAIAHNMAQLIVASVLLSTMTVYYYSPILIISGVIMGAVTGTTIRVILPAISKAKPTQDSTKSTDHHNPEII